MVAIVADRCFIDFCILMVPMAVSENVQDRWPPLRGDRYEPLAIQEGIYRSEVFPGLWLDAGALIRGDMLRVFSVLQEGIDSPEHARFSEERGKGG